VLCQRNSPQISTYAFSATWALTVTVSTDGALLILHTPGPSTTACYAVKSGAICHCGARGGFGTPGNIDTIFTIPRIRFIRLCWWSVGWSSIQIRLQDRSTSCYDTSTELGDSFGALLSSKLGRCFSLGKCNICHAGEVVGRHSVSGVHTALLLILRALRS
jgi:hypothetical protein